MSNPRRSLYLLIVSLAVLAPACSHSPRLDVIYEPSAMDVVQTMLEGAAVTNRDVVYDLGSGDGRIPITAAAKYGARGVGIDLDPKRIEEANANAQRAGVTGQVRFLQQDLFKSDFSEASVVTLYLQPGLNLRLRPQLFRQLKPGTRVVSHSHSMGNWKPERVVKTKSGKTLYFWTIPNVVPAELRD